MDGKIIDDKLILMAIAVVAFSARRRRDIKPRTEKRRSRATIEYDQFEWTLDTWPPIRFHRICR